MVKDMSKKEETVKVKKKPKIKHLRMEDIIKNNSIEVDHTIRKIKEREFRLTVMWVCIFLVAIISTTFTVAFSVQKIKEYNQVNSGDLVITFEENNEVLDDIITLDNDDVLSYKDGLENDSYKFSIKNSGDKKVKYKIRLVDDVDMIEYDDCSKMQFNKKNMFFSLNDHIVGIVADLYNGEEYIISEETIDSNEVKNYEIKFWVDKTYVNNGHYHGKIIVEETK